ncbi:MAG: adenylate/guanylate cyclase domain-containing protein [Pseudomonadota bacterium]
MLGRLLKFKYGMLMLVVSIAASVLVYLWNPPVVQSVRNASFDQYQRWQPRAYLPAPVHIIDIDEESLRRLGQWPWPRTRMAELVTRLQQAGASAIAFDIIFSEADRTSPQSMLALWHPPAGVVRDLSALPDHDSLFATAIGRANVVLGFALDQGASGEGKSPQALPDTKANYIALGPPAQPYLHSFNSALTSLPGLQSAASGNGAITFIPDSDGIVRKVPILVRQDNHILPSLAAEALRVAQHAKHYIVHTEAQQGMGLSDVRIGQLVIPTTPQGETWVHYTRPVASRYIPAWKVLAGQVPADMLKDNILLVGTSAHGLMDLRFSPVSGAIPGVEIHAQMLEQVLTGFGLSRPGWAKAVEVIAIVAGGVLIGIVTLASGGLLPLCTLLVVLLLMGAGGLAAYWGQLLLDPIIPALSLMLVFVVAGISRHTVVENHQRWVRQAFSRYISPNLLNYLIDHPDALVLSARRTQCSFIFTDLAGFTSLMEKLDPGEATKRLNTYLDSMIAIAFAHQGTLDRIVGDAVAIMFSAPVRQVDHQQRALECALAMHAFAQDYLAELNRQGHEFCATRIGVHSGEVVVGNFGGAAIFDYRALGDPVNTASRLEQANKQLGTLICVSEATLSGCRNIPARPVGQLQVKGKSGLLKIFEPSLKPPENNAEYLAAFSLMCAHEADALPTFERLLQRYPADPLVILHVDRLQRGQRGDVISGRENDVQK